LIIPFFEQKQKLFKLVFDYFLNGLLSTVYNKNQVNINKHKWTQEVTKYNLVPSLHSYWPHNFPSRKKKLKLWKWNINAKRQISQIICHFSNKTYFYPDYPYKCILCFSCHYQTNFIFTCCIITAKPIISLFYLFNELGSSLSPRSLIPLLLFTFSRLWIPMPRAYLPMKTSNVAYVSLGLYVRRRNSIAVRLCLMLEIDYRAI